MTRIDDTFARLTAEGRKAFVSYIMAGDPDYDRSLEIVRGPAGRGRRYHRTGPALHRSHGRRPHDPACRPARPCQRPDARPDPADGARLPRGRRHHADRADGLLQPDLFARRRPFLEDATEAGIDGLIIVDLPPEEDDELCIPAQKAGLNFIRLATPTTDDKRLPKVLPEHIGLRLLRLDHRHHRRGRGGGGRRRPRGGAYQVESREPARWSSASASRPPRRPRPSRASPMAAVVGSAIVERIAAGDSTDEVLAFVKSLADGAHRA